MSFVLFNTLIFCTAVISAQSSFQPDFLILGVTKCGTASMYSYHIIKNQKECLIESLGGINKRLSLFWIKRGNYASLTIQRVAYVSAIKKPFYLSGVPNRTRTCGLEFRKLSLYPPELQAQQRHQNTFFDVVCKILVLAAVKNYCGGVKPPQ